MMSTELKIFILPALLALLIKLFVLVISRKGVGETSMFFTMVVVFAGHNLAEVLGYLEFFNGERFTQVLRWYYTMSVAGLAAMLMYSIEVSRIHSNNRPIFAVIVSMAGVIGILVMQTNLIVAGSHSIGYSLTADRGDYYWVFQMASLTSFVAIVSYLIVGYKKADNHLTEIRCSYVLLALAPMVITCIGLIFLMISGSNLNASGLLPISTALFLLITLKSEHKHRLTDIRRHIPLSLERRKSSEIMEIFSAYAKDEMNYRDCLNEIEKLLVTYKHDKNGGNVSVTASTMDIPRSSLYSIFRRLEIHHKE